MATIRKIPVLWGGLPAMPGYSVFYSGGAVDATAELVTFFAAIKSLFLLNLTWSIPPGGDTLDDATGQINGAWVGAGAAVVSANGAGVYAAGTGAYANWPTAGIVAGRRVKGRTFLCPLTTGSYDASGTISTASLATLTGAVTTLAAAGKLVIWSRPNAAAVRAGSSYLVIAGTVPDQVTSLRSRRR